MQMNLSKTVRNLLIAFGVVFVIQQTSDLYLGGNLKGILGLSGSGFFSGQIWQLFTYPFVHSSLMQLLFSGLMLAFFAADLEAIWGRAQFLRFYLICSLGAGAFYLFVQVLIGNVGLAGIPLTGSTAGLAGLLMAYGMMFPDRQMLFFMLFPLKGMQLVWVMVGMNFLSTLFSSRQAALPAVAELAGMGTGYLLLWYQAKGFRLAGKRKKTASKQAKHLRLIKTEVDSDDDEGPRNPKTWH